MNKKDIEHIGYLFSTQLNRDQILAALIQWDNRIQYKYESFCEAQEDSDAVSERYMELLSERYGHNWCLLKDKSQFSKIYKQAQKEILQKYDI